MPGRARAPPNLLSAVPLRPGAGAVHAGVDLWWIPLGAGGRFVRGNGRLYELVKARQERRSPQPLFHTALELHLPEATYVVETAWPIPRGEPSSRGVVAQGPVFSRRFGRWRTLRYEVRCWKAGVIADRGWVPDGPQRVSDDPGLARRILALAPTVPVHVWGRKLDGAEEMWNSNSVVAWLLARAGAAVAGLRPPGGGRAPGWTTGIALARAG